jgi:hypothetical protein
METEIEIEIYRCMLPIVQIAIANYPPFPRKVNFAKFVYQMYTLSVLA